MGGIDKSDQLAVNHQAAHKSLKWYKELFFYVLDLTLVNSYCVYLATGHRLSFLDFRLQLVREFIFDEPLPGYRPQRDAQPANFRFTGQHFPAYVNRSSEGLYLYRRCTHCSSQGW